MVNQCLICFLKKLQLKEGVKVTPESLLILFRVRFPEFVTQADDRLTMYINDALCIHALCETAVLYLTAHLLTLDMESGAGSIGAGSDGGGGEVVSERAGGVSATYKSQAAKEKDVFYMSTAYGRRYVALRNACPGYKFSVRIV
jgi:hypothetical protein